jgi:hypothetical protein
MPKIDEAKLADILNSLLTDSINRGENLIGKLEKSTDSFNKSVESFSNNISSRTSEIQELTKILANAPKISKTLKLSSLAASFVAGAAFAALIYAYPLSSITYKFIQAEIDSAKYTELENYALVLQNQNEAYKRSLEKTLTLNGRERFNEIFSEELQKIIQKESK